MEPSADNEMIYTLSLPLYLGDHAYKYFRVINDTASWNNGEWDGPPDRIVTVDSAITVNDVWGTLGIFEQPEEVTFRLYPNPVSNVLTIDYLNNPERIEIYNLAGMKVRTIDNIRTPSVNINTSELPTGMYMIVVNHDGGVQATKFLKN
jgi:hypothetical protein